MHRHRLRSLLTIASVAISFLVLVLALQNILGLRETLWQAPGEGLLVVVFLVCLFGWRLRDLDRPTPTSTATISACSPSAATSEMAKRFNPALRARCTRGWTAGCSTPPLTASEDFCGKRPLPRPQLAQWLAEQEQKEAWLRGRSIRYLLAAAPNKQSIYLEKLMAKAPAIKGTTRFEQLEQRLGGRLPPYMVDLHTPLRRLGGGKNLYLNTIPTGTRWGAYLAFGELFQRIGALFPDFKPTTEFAFGPTGYGGNDNLGGDLALILQRDRERTETYPQLQRFERCAQPLPFPRGSATCPPRRPATFAWGCPTCNLTAVVFRDSFFTLLERLFVENFRRRKDYSQENMEEILTFLKPDLVLEIKVERHLFDLQAPRPESDLPGSRKGHGVLRPDDSGRVSTYAWSAGKPGTAFLAREAKIGFDNAARNQHKASRNARSLPCPLAFIVVFSSTSPFCSAFPAGNAHRLLSSPATG